MKTIKTIVWLDNPNNLTYNEGVPKNPIVTVCDNRMRANHFRAASHVDIIPFFVTITVSIEIDYFCALYFYLFISSSAVPDLAPLDFWMFLRLKEEAAGTTFDRRQDLD
jgi:hypothetical protein